MNLQDSLINQMNVQKDINNKSTANINNTFTKGNISGETNFKDRQKSNNSIIRVVCKDGKPQILDGDNFDKVTFINDLRKVMRECDISDLEKNEFITKIGKAYSIPSDIFVNSGISIDKNLNDMMSIANESPKTPYTKKEVEMQDVADGSIKTNVRRLDDATYNDCWNKIKKSSDLNEVMQAKDDMMNGSIGTSADDNLKKYSKSNPFVDPSSNKKYINSGNGVVRKLYTSRLKTDLTEEAKSPHNNNDGRSKNGYSVLEGDSTKDKEQAISDNFSDSNSDSESEV